MVLGPRFDPATTAQRAFFDLDVGLGRRDRDFTGSMRLTPPIIKLSLRSSKVDILRLLPVNAERYISPVFDNCPRQSSFSNHTTHTLILSPDIVL